MKKITKEILAQTIKKRTAISHKGTYGRVCLIGGNEQYGGAIMLASQACVHSGAGLVTVFTAAENHSSIRSVLPEAMLIDWKKHHQFQDIIKQATTVVIGPGLGLDQFSLTLLKSCLTLLQQTQTCIIDGSAITLIAQHAIQLPSGPTYVFTPHEMEWQRLSGIEITQQNERANKQAQIDLNSIIVLKKHRTEVYTAHDNWLNTLGTPAMATGGMGDTLAGIIGGFTAQFKHTENAVLSAVFLHSFIGEQEGTEQYVVLPSKIIQQISKTMKKFEA